MYSMSKAINYYYYYYMFDMMPSPYLFFFNV